MTGRMTPGAMAQLRFLEPTCYRGITDGQKTADRSILLFSKLMISAASIRSDRRDVCWLARATWHLRAGKSCSRHDMRETADSACRARGADVVIGLTSTPITLP